MTVSVVFAIAGVIALLFGIIGGGIKAKEIEVPLLSTRIRIITVIIGLVLIGFTLWLENNRNKSPQVMTVVQTPDLSTPVQTETTITATAPSMTEQTNILSAARNWRSIVFDDFTSSSNQFWLDDNKDNLKCELVSEKYLCTLYPHTAVAHWHWVGYRDQLTDQFYLATEARVVSGSSDAEYSLMFRRNDNPNYYLFTVRNDGYFKVNK